MPAGLDTGDNAYVFERRVHKTGSVTTGLIDLYTKAMPRDAEGSRSLRSQTVILKPGSRGQHRKYRPWAFTEHGAIMAATILRSPLPIQMSVYEVRSFVRMREKLIIHSVILRRLAQTDKKLMEQDLVLQEVIENSSLCLTRRPKRSSPGDGLDFSRRTTECFNALTRAPRSDMT